MHPLVEHLHFARSEFVRCLEGVSEEAAIQRLVPMNCISWMVGHLANQEQRYWVERAQKRTVVSGLNNRVGYGQPASTPPLSEMWEAWQTVTAAADEYLVTLTPSDLLTTLMVDGKLMTENVGQLLYRNLYHYWFHTGEAHAVRQQLGDGDLPQFVGVLPAFRSDGW